MEHVYAMKVEMLLDRGNCHNYLFGAAGEGGGVSEPQFDAAVVRICTGDNAAGTFSDGGVDQSFIACDAATASGEPRMDGAFDKLIFKLVDPEFP